MDQQLQELEALRREKEHLQAQVENNQGAANILEDLASKGKIRFSEGGEVILPSEQKKDQFNV